MAKVILFLLATVGLFFANNLFGDEIYFYHIVNLLGERIILEKVKTSEKKLSETLQNHLSSLTGSIITDNAILIDKRVQELFFSISGQTYTAKIPSNIQNGTKLFFEKTNDQYTLSTSTSAPIQYMIPLQMSTITDQQIAGQQQRPQQKRYIGLEVQEFKIPTDIETEIAKEELNLELFSGKPTATPHKDEMELRLREQGMDFGDFAQREEPQLPPAPPSQPIEPAKKSAAKKTATPR